MSEQETRRSSIGLRSELEEDELVEAIGLDDEECVAKEFVGFDGDDEANLTELTELFETIADEFTRTFYEHLTSYDETTDVLGRSDRSLEQLKETQAQYLRSLGANAYDTGADPGYGVTIFASEQWSANFTACSRCHRNTTSARTCSTTRCSSRSCSTDSSRISR